MLLRLRILSRFAVTVWFWDPTEKAAADATEKSKRLDKGEEKRESVETLQKKENRERSGDNAADNITDDIDSLSLD